MRRKGVGVENSGSITESKAGGKSALLAEIVCSVWNEKLHLIFIFFKTSSPISIKKSILLPQKCFIFKSPSK